MNARALESRRYAHERTGEPLPAYVIGGYVVEKNRRDWDHRVPGQNVEMWAGPKEWWEVRRQGSLTQPGVSIGPKLYDARTLRECREWIKEQE
jgi:hypothetical protein